MKPTHFVLIVTSALVLAACSRPEPAPEPVRSVKLLTVGAQGLVAQTEYAGEVRARTESRLGFRVGGKLLERPAASLSRSIASLRLDSSTPRWAISYWRQRVLTSLMTSLTLRISACLASANCSC